MSGSEGQNVDVAMRVRPRNQRELDQGDCSDWVVNDESLTQCTANGRPIPTASYSYDHVFGYGSKTEEVYQTVAKKIVLSTMDGMNGTIFAYGQTSSGKTHTMMGSDDEYGVIPLAVNEIFEHIESSDQKQHCLRVFCMEIYNETITDLLDTTKVSLKIKENYDGEIGVKELTEEPVGSPEEVLELMMSAINSRQVAATKMNDTPPRSHTIFKVIVESRSLDEDDDGAIRMACLNLVDLAGSERIKNTGAAGDRLKEAGNINKSLLTLGSVIGKLAEGADGAHIPYRDSKLTRILQNSLGGNARTAMICAVTPASVHAEETISSLKFASRAANIKNDAKINEILNEDAQMKRYERTIAELEQEVAQLREHRTGATTESNESQEKEELAANLAKQEALYRKQQGEIERLKGLMLQASPGKRHGSSKSNGGDRRRTWCPGQEASSGGGRKGSSRRSVGFGLDSTSVLASAKKARRSMGASLGGGNDGFGAVSVRDRRSRRSVLLPPPLEQLNEHGKEDVGLLKKRNQVLETKTEEQLKEIAALKGQVAAVQAEVGTLSESLESKSTALTEIQATATATADSKAGEYEARFAKIEAGYKDEIVQLKENQGFMQEELDVWASTADEEESKMERLISPSRLTKAENEMKEKLDAQETQHAEALATEVAELKAKHQAGAEELQANHEAEIAACKMQVDEKVQLESEVSELVIQSSQLKTENADLEKMLDEVTDKNIALDTLIKQHNQDFAAAQATVDELAASLEQALSTSASSSTSEAEIEASKGTIAELEAKIASLEEAHAEQIASMTKEMEDSAAESAEAIRFVNVELSESNENSAQLEAAIDASSEMHAETVDKHAVEIAQLEASLQLQADAAAKEVAAKFEVAAAELETSKEDLVAQLEDASSKLADAEARMADASNTHAATLAQLDSAYVELNTARSPSGAAGGAAAGAGAGAGAGTATPIQTPKKSNIFSAVKNTFSTKKAKKKRKLFKKGAISSPSDDQFDNSSRSSRPLVDHLVTPAKRSETPVTEEEISTQLFKVQADAQEEVVRALKVQVATANEELTNARTVQQSLEVRTEELEAELEGLVDMNTLLQSTIDRMTPEDMVREAGSAEKRPRDAMTPSGGTPMRPNKQHINDSMSMSTSMSPPMLSLADELATSPVKKVNATEETTPFVFEGMIDGMTMVAIAASSSASTFDVPAQAVVDAAADAAATADADAAAAAAKDQIAFANTEIARLQAELEDAVLDSTAQKAFVEELQAKVDVLIAEATQNSQQLSKLSTDSALAESLRYSAAETLVGNHVEAVQAMQAQLDSARAEVTELAEQNEGLEDTGLEHLEAISTLENDVAEAKADAASFKAQLDSAAEVFETTQAELTTEVIRKEELETEVEALSQSLVEVKVEIETVKAERSEVQEQLAAFTEGLDADRQGMAMQAGAANDAIQTLTGRVTELQAEVAEKQGAFEEMEDKLLKLVEEAESDIEKFAAAQGELVESKAEVEGLKGELQTTHALLAEAREQATQADERLDEACLEMQQEREAEMQERAAAEGESTKASAEELTDAQNEIANLNAQIGGMNEELEQERVAAQNAKTKADAEKAKLTDDLMDRDIDKETQDGTIDAMKEDCGKLRVNNDSLEKNCSELRDEIDELQMQLTASQESVQKQLAASQETAQASESTVAESAQVHAQLEKAMRDAEERAESSDASDAYHMQKIQEYEQTMAGLQSDLESTQREMQHTTEQADTAQNEVSKLGSYVAKLEAETKEIVGLKGELMQMREQLAAAQSEARKNGGLQDELVQIKQKLAAAQTKAASGVNISQVTHSGIMDGVAPRVKQSRSGSRKATMQPSKKRVAAALSSATAAAAAPVAAPASTAAKPTSILRATKVTFDDEKNEVRSFQPGENETRTPDTSILSPAPVAVVTAAKATQPARRALKDRNSSDSGLAARPAKKAKARESHQVLSMENPPSTPSSKLQTSWEPAPATLTSTFDGTASKASSILKDAKLARKATGSHRSSTARRTVAQDTVEEDPAECATQ